MPRVVLSRRRSASDCETGSVTALSWVDGVRSAVLRDPTIRPASVAPGRWRSPDKPRRIGGLSNGFGWAVNLALARGKAATMVARPGQDVESNCQYLWVRRDVAHVSELVDWRSVMPVA